MLIVQLNPSKFRSSQARLRSRRSDCLCQVQIYAILKKDVDKHLTIKKYSVLLCIHEDNFGRS